MTTVDDTSDRRDPAHPAYVGRDPCGIRGVVECEGNAAHVVSTELQQRMVALVRRFAASPMCAGDLHTMREASAIVADPGFPEEVDAVREEAAEALRNFASPSNVRAEGDTVVQQGIPGTAPYPRATTRFSDDVMADLVEVARMVRDEADPVKLMSRACSVLAELPGPADADLVEAETFVREQGWLETDANFDSAIALAKSAISRGKQMAGEA